MHRTYIKLYVGQQVDLKNCLNIELRNRSVNTEVERIDVFADKFWFDFFPHIDKELFFPTEKANHIY